MRFRMSVRKFVLCALLASSSMFAVVADAGSAYGQVVPDTEVAPAGDSASVTAGQLDARGEDADRAGASEETYEQIELEYPSVLLQSRQATMLFGWPSGPADTTASYALRMEDGTFPLRATADGLVAEGVPLTAFGKTRVEVLRGSQVVATDEIVVIPGWISILPPLLAIAIALIFKQVIPALFFGIWMGAFAALGMDLSAFGKGFLDSFQIYVLAALADADHASIILFSLMIGGMVGIITRNGGMQGVVGHVVKWTKTARDGQLATAILGIAIFFDDYANTLVVGNTMRAVTDKLRISREKLAYLVDSTAAPVACLALVSTWIGYEVGIIGTSVAAIPGYDESAYAIFLNSIPYSFYPVLTIFFVFAISVTPKEFGPMLRAERRARLTGDVLSPRAQVDEAAASEKELGAKAGIPHRAINAIFPVVTLVVSVLVGLYASGEGDSIRDIIGSADSYKALMWGSLLGVSAAVILTAAQRLLSVNDTINAWYTGVRSMLYAMIILTLAWGLSAVTDVLHTADYLVSVLGDALPPGLIPAIVFVIAAATAFSTGTSWGTMGILMPLVIPLSWAVLELNGMATPENYHIIYSSVACVLAGAVWGDHCSPISDTTILSSMASGCDHVDHVTTQLPYAVLVGAVAVLIGTIPTGFGFPWWLSMLIGAAALYVSLQVFGKRIEPGKVEAVERG